MSLLIILACSVYFLVLLYLKQLIDYFIKTKIKLKILQSDSQVFNSLFSASSTEESDYLANISPSQIFTVYKNIKNESQNVIHLLLSFNCKHCKQLYTDLYHSFDVLNVSHIRISFVQAPFIKGSEEYLLQRLSASSDSDPQKNAQLINAYYSHKLGKLRTPISPKELSGKLTLPSIVPITFLNGKIFPAVFEIEDLYRYLKYESKQ